MMRTIINIDGQLLMYAKLQATQQGCTLKQIIEDALREFFHFTAWILLIFDKKVIRISSLQFHFFILKVLFLNIYY
jgi:hypothetical protein